MTVESSTPERAGDSARHAGGRSAPAHSPTAWIKQHKGPAIAIAGGGALLLLSHKGSGGSSSNSGGADQAATDAAAEQAAIDGATQAQQAADDASGGGSSDDGSGTDGTGSSSDGTDSNGGTSTGDAGDGGTASDGTQSGGVTINVASPAAAKSATKRKPAKPTTKHTPEAGKNTRKHNAENKNDGGHKDTHTTSKHDTKTPSTAGHKKAAPKTPPAKTRPRTKTRGSVMKYGRAFPGALACHVTKNNASSDGVLHEVVVVNYGGYTEAHMAHNRGQAWTDNVPGYTPPSRGVPLERLGT